MPMASCSFSSAQVYADRRTVQLVYGCNPAAPPTITMPSPGGTVYANGVAVGIIASFHGITISGEGSEILSIYVRLSVAVDPYATITIDVPSNLFVEAGYSFSAASGASVTNNGDVSGPLYKAISDTSPTEWFRLNRPTTAAVVSETSSKQGTWHGTPTLSVPGPDWLDGTSAAATFDGTNDSSTYQLLQTNYAPPYGTSARTFLLIFKSTDTGSSRGMLVYGSSVDPNTAPGERINIGLGGGHPRTIANPRSKRTLPTLTDGDWHSVFYVFPASETNILKTKQFVDGQFQISLIGAVHDNVTSTSNTTTTFSGTDNLPHAPPEDDDIYVGYMVVWTSGALKGQVFTVSDYDSATKTFTVDTMPLAPSPSDTFDLVGSASGYSYNIANDLNLSIGGHPVLAGSGSTSNIIAGTIAEAVIWNSALSENQMRHIFNRYRRSLKKHVFRGRKHTLGVQL